jgi:Regulator of RNA terminal phosphate cyclase
MKVLLTFTGFNDPYSKSVVAGEEKTGPILSLLAARKFDHVILLSTPATATLTEDTADLISATDVTIIRLNLPDPTDYLAILRELRREIVAIRDQNLNAELFVATASGTPQMHACWFLLTASGELPASLLHMRPPRFVTKDFELRRELRQSQQVTVSRSLKIVTNGMVSVENEGRQGKQRRALQECNSSRNTLPETHPDERRYGRSRAAMKTTR